MFKSTRAFFNALTEKKVTKNKLDLHDKSGKNLVKLESDDPRVCEINKLANDVRCNNIRVYGKNMAKLIGKKAIFTTPIILGGIIISSFVNGKYIKTINVSDICQDTIIEFDENSLLSKSEITYAKTFFNKNYVDESIVSKNDMDVVDTSSYASIYYGEGSNSFQVKFNINKDNTWEYSSHTNNLYQKTETDVIEPIGELDKEYKQLIQNVTNTFIKQAKLSEEEISLLREFVSNNENDIIVKIKKCTILEDQDLEVHSFHLFRCIIEVIAGIILLKLLFENLDKLTTVDELEASGSKIVRRHTYINLLKATKNYKEEFLLAESNRMSSIFNLLKDNGGNEETLAIIEKRLKPIYEETIAIHKKRLKHGKNKI